jgi:uncharacterized protein YllA (UPF0747 family)
MMRIPFGSLPSTSRLFLDYVTDWTRLRKFYPQSYSLESIAAFARQRPAITTAQREKLCAALTGDSTSIQKLAAGATVVITGQQPGLFTGPNYTILKALTVIKLAKALDSTGVPAVPVFWVAAEDHDYQEIESTFVLDRNSGLEHLRVDLSNLEISPVGWLSFADDVAAAVQKCLSSLPDSEFQTEVRDLVDSAYKPGVSPVDAFSAMMAKLFRGTGLLIANPLQRDIRKLAEPTLVEAVHRNSDIRAAVIARSRALSDSGYHEQVKVDDDFTGLFAYRDKSRQPLRREQLRDDLALSANVLIRPAMQDAIFPTAAYVGGPAEVAYFAQAGAVYDVLGRHVPPVFPRISATLIEPKVDRVLKKYDMEFQDVFRGREFLRRKAVVTVQGVELFDHVRDRLSAELESLRPSLNAVDSTLAAALDTSRQKVLHQVEALRTKFVNAEARRHETLERHIDTVVNSLLPEKKLQERVINITSFLVRYGLGLIRRLETELDLDTREHQVIDI